MANILDYLDWRGDLTLEREPFCDVDALVLSRLSYVPFDGIVSEDFSAEPIPLGEAAGACIALLHEKDSQLALHLDADEQLLTKLIESPRYSELGLIGYVNRFSKEEEEQFCAISILLPENEMFVAYRGTDGTLIGWKEDFNMSFADVVPAQQDAVKYLEAAAASFDGKLRLGGHSKGGNLSVYASAFCNPAIQSRILRVCNNDGPGFNDNAVSQPGFQAIIQRVHTYLPQSSVIGMLLEHEEAFSVIHSTEHGLSQHDVYSWEISRNGFIPVEGLTNSSVFIDRTLKDWVQSMTPEIREKLIDGVFGVLSASEGTTLRDLWNGKNTIVVMKAIGNMDDETKELLKEAYRILTGSMKKTFTGLMDALTAKNASRSSVELPQALKRFLAQRGTLLAAKEPNELENQEPHN